MKLRILDFDIENRPLAYLGDDYTTGEVTAIAACWADNPKSMCVWLLGRDGPGEMLRSFRVLYDAADIVTGHYIRGHDLPVLNGAYVEHGLSPLSEKMTSDTKIDLVERKYLSASQENLAEMLGIPNRKAHLSNTQWREANRLTPTGLEFTKARVVADVRQHMALRRVLVARELLKAPVMWRG